MDNPAPYSAYMNFGDEVILSTSPERFLHCRNGVANTRPIKGTRPRGRNRDEQSSLERELASSEKERAELLMIVDLERNDLGRVCEIGSVEVDNLFALETYACHTPDSLGFGSPSERKGRFGFWAMFPGDL